MIKDMLAHAKDLVAEGETRLLAQEARVAKLEGKGREGRESRKLLWIMRATQSLQISHVRLLEREIEEIGSVNPASASGAGRPDSERGTRE